MFFFGLRFFLVSLCCSCSRDSHDALLLVGCLWTSRRLFQFQWSGRAKGEHLGYIHVARCWCLLGGLWRFQLGMNFRPSKVDISDSYRWVISVVSKTSLWHVLDENLLIAPSIFGAWRTPCHILANAMMHGDVQDPHRLPCRCKLQMFDVCHYFLVGVQDVSRVF